MLIKLLFIDIIHHNFLLIEEGLISTMFVLHVNNIILYCGQWIKQREDFI